MTRLSTPVAALVAALLLSLVPAAAVAKPGNGNGPKPGRGPAHAPGLANKPADVGVLLAEEAELPPADDPAAGDPVVEEPVVEEPVVEEPVDEPAVLDLTGYCERAARGSAASTDACVSALERIAAGETSAPGQACRGVARKKGKGAKAKGTPFSDCVRAASRLLDDLAELPEEPVDEEPVGEEPTGEEPTGEEPGSEDPGAVPPVEEETAPVV